MSKSIHLGENETPISGKKSLWTQLRSTILRRKGLVEILPGHPKYDMTGKEAKNIFIPFINL